MIDAAELRDKVAAECRSNKDLQELVAIMPLHDEAKDAIWEVLITAFFLGMKWVLDRETRQMKTWTALICLFRGHDWSKWAYRKNGGEPMTVRTHRCKRCGYSESEEAPTPKRTRMTAKRELREMNGADTIKGPT